MTEQRRLPKVIAAATATLLAMVLTGCMLSAGKFASTLDLRRDGRFTYSYSGEIYLLGLSKLVEMGRKSDGNGTFEAAPCYNDDADAAERDCTKDELAQQKEDWDAAAKRRAEKDKREGEMMRAMLGGIDPADPKAADELAARLRKQAGWRSVEYKGDGLFVVDFTLSGMVDHDFTFPTIERFPMANAFVTINRRSDGTLRIDAPGFGRGANGDPLRSFAMLAAMGEKQEDVPQLPELNGTFTLTTDATILANNTEDGPKTDQGAQRLDWTITPRTTVVPTALIKLGN